MFKEKISRREMLRNTGLMFIGSSLVGLTSCLPKGGNQGNVAVSGNLKGRLPFRINLNTSTISGYKLPIEEQIDLCIEAGFDGIELWVRDVLSYIEMGGTLEKLAIRMKNGGLLLENMIGFSNWIADDNTRRKEGVGIMRRDMELTARLGGRFIAAPAQGIDSIERNKLSIYADRYRTILGYGDETEVTPILELWGGGVLNQLSDTVAITVGAAHPKASMLLDFYHLYRGGNSFESLRQINGANLQVFHINDYPAYPPQSELNDSDRVFPGDGICPFNEVLPLLHDIGFRGGLSVELFNRGYWDTMDVKTVLKNSYDKTVKVIEQAIRREEL
jgi:sugar phosphate isomerase/epimerase